jgi:hypothetical protein
VRNIYAGAFRAITNRYLDDFEFGEQQFENEDGWDDENHSEESAEEESEEETLKNSLAASETEPSEPIQFPANESGEPPLQEAA